MWAPKSQPYRQENYSTYKTRRKLKRQIYELTLSADLEEAAARLEKASEVRKIEAAKRLEEAADVTEEVKQEIVADREKQFAEQSASDEREDNDENVVLSRKEELAIIALGQWKGTNSYVSSLAKDKATFYNASKVIPNLTENRLEVELMSAFKQLQMQGYATVSGSEWSLTEKGYLRYDELIDK